VRIIQPADEQGGREGLGIAIRRNNPELKAQLQKALDEILADGTYKEISMRWVGSDIR
jgi:polar amino acid transport system substrate-binding protein